MAKGPESLLESLADEAMSEMAGNFFGARKEVEELLERIHGMAEELRRKAGRTLQQGAVLHALLPGDAAAGFYAALGVDPQPYVTQVPPARPEDTAGLDPPFAFTARGRYVGLALLLYGAFRRDVEEYLHGSYQDDRRHKGRKFLSANLRLLQNLAARANERIDVVNASPSQVLRLAHTMDVAEVERERMTGATLEGFDEALDRDLAYKKVDVPALGLPDLPDLPPPEQAKARLKPFLRAAWDEHRAEILARVKL